MPDDGASQLTPVTDMIYVARRVFGPKMSAQDIATHLMRDLVVMGSLPAQVERIGVWWVISSEKDWLLGLDGSVSLQHFSHIVHFPEAGIQANHNEILVSAFADAAITWGSTEGLTWIVGDQVQWTLPAAILDRMSCRRSGRFVAYLVK